MPILRIPAVAFALLTVAVATSCIDTTSSSTRGVASLAVTPVFAAEGLALQQSAPITRIRLTARRTPGNDVLETRTFSVSPDAEEWRLDFAIPVPSGPEVQVMVTIEVISVVDGVETVEWSGIAGPYTLAPGPVGSPAQVPIVRGPLDNVGITGVTITTQSPSVDEGRTTTLNAQVNGGGPGAVIFWSSLDPDIATVNQQGVVTGVVPGTARIVATAGQHSAQVNVAVNVRIETITLTPPTATLTSLGATQAFTARAVDPRGADVTGVTFTFSVSPATVATHDGDGVMRAVGNGAATVSATARGTTGNATLTVQQAPASIVITPSNPVIENIGGTVTLAATVRDANDNAINGATVTWESLTPGIATVNPTTGTVTGAGSGVAQILARASATVTATVNVAVGSLVFLSDGLETGTGWSFGGNALRTNGAGITNTAAPVYVSPPGTTLPGAPEGSFYLWFGGPQQGNYMGTQAVSDPPLSGGTSDVATGGAAASPEFTIPAGVPTIYVSFRSWFEIESFDPSDFDLMTVAIVDAQTSQVIAAASLNSGLSGVGQADLPETSAGGTAEPVFVPIELDANGLGGRTVRLLFGFETGDIQFNGFRGWIVDDIRVASTPGAQPPALRASSVAAPSRTMETCGGGGCVRVERKRGRE